MTQDKSSRKEVKVAFETVLVDLITKIAKENFQSRTEFIRRACIEKLNSMLDEEVMRSALINSNNR